MRWLTPQHKSRPNWQGSGEIICCIAKVHSSFWKLRRHHARGREKKHIHENLSVWNGTCSYQHLGLYSCCFSSDCHKIPSSIFPEVTFQLSQGECESFAFSVMGVGQGLGILIGQMLLGRAPWCPHAQVRLPEHMPFVSQVSLTDWKEQQPFGRRFEKLADKVWSGSAFLARNPWQPGQIDFDFPVTIIKCLLVIYITYSRNNFSTWSICSLFTISSMMCRHKWILQPL